MKKKRLQYDRVNLERAYTACKGGMSVYKAAIIYSVPESTLRDRTREKIPLDAHVGYSTIFTANEEKALVDHIKYMGDIGNLQAIPLPPPQLSLTVRMKKEKTLKIPKIQHFLPAEQSLQLYRNLKRDLSLHFSREVYPKRQTSTS